MAGTLIVVAACGAVAFLVLLLEVVFPDADVLGHDLEDEHQAREALYGQRHCWRCGGREHRSGLCLAHYEQVAFDRDDRCDDE